MTSTAQVAPYAGNASLDDELLTDPEMARDLRVGMTSWFELQKQPDFPAPIWLGPRLKRHRRRLVRQWALARTTKPVEAA